MGQNLPRNPQEAGAPLRFASLVQDLQQNTLQSYGLTYTEYLFLHTVVKAKNLTLLHQQDIGRKFGINKMTTSRVLRSLRKKELIYIVNNPMDRRAKIVRHRVKAQHLIKRTEKAMSARETQLLKEINLLK